MPTDHRKARNKRLPFGAQPRPWGLSILALSLLLGWGQGAHALPEAGVVTSGSATITNAAAGNLTITQTSQNASLRWQTFNIGAGESVRFIQPNSSSIAVNRVLSSDPSQILGNLSANGSVFLINPNGILFGQNASINVGGLVASALDLNQEDSATGRYRFAGQSKGDVTNLGAILTPDGGYVALLGNRVHNAGTIVSNLGTVALAAGSQIALNMAPDGLVQIAVEQSALNALVVNGGLLQANGGAVYLSAQARDAALNTVINNTGMVQAQSVGSRNGRIYLDGGDSGLVNHSGALNAAGLTAGSSGGTVIATGDKVLVADGASMDARGDAGGGTILVGGGWQGKDPSVRQAQGVYIGQNATLDASALRQGDGGTVVAWSNVGLAGSTTRVYGSLRARGGAEGGNGGRVETSGHWLDVRGVRVKADAPKGHAGQWLLDPEDLMVIATPGNIGPIAGPPTLFGSGGGFSLVQNTDIETELNAGTDVVLQTGPLTGGSGNITIAANIAKTAGGNAALSLFADGNIVLGSGNSIASTSGAMDVNLLAGGNVVLGAGSSVTTNGGELVANGTAFINNAGAGVFNTGAGRWVVYANDAATSVLTGLNSGNADVLGQTLGSLAPTSLGPGNWYVFAAVTSPSQTITGVQAGVNVLAGGACGPSSSDLLCVQSLSSFIDDFGGFPFARSTLALDSSAMILGSSSGTPVGVSPTPPSPPPFLGGPGTGASTEIASVGSSNGAPPGTSRFSSAGFRGISKPNSGATASKPGTQTVQSVFLRGAVRASAVGTTTSGSVLVSSLITNTKSPRMLITVAPGEGFSIRLPDDALGKLKGGKAPLVASVGGGVLPSWLAFDPVRLSFQATSVPATALPVTVRLQRADGVTADVTFQ
jgi:filamentous hemagglutinin family protein